MKKEYVYIILSALIFSTMEIAGKTIATEINPFQLNFWRFLIGAIILLPMAIRSLHHKHIVWNKNDILYFLLTGLLGVVLSMSFFQLAIIYTKASTVAILFSVNPIFTIPFACLLLREKWDMTTIAALSVSVTGVMFIVSSSTIGPDIRGIMFSLSSAVTFALFGIICKKRAAKYGGIVINCFSFLAGDLLLFILMLASHLPIIGQLMPQRFSSLFVDISFFSGINQGNISTLLYLSIIVTGFGFLFYFLAMEHSSASIASVVFFLKPVLAPVFAFLLLKETIPLNTMLGIFAILVGACFMVNGKHNTETLSRRKVRYSA